MSESKWPRGFIIRAPQPEEAQQVSDLICACDIADTGEPDWDVEETRGDWMRLGFDLARDARVVVAPDGRLAAYTDVHRRPNAVDIAANSCLHPDFRSPDLNSTFMDLIEALAAQNAPLPIRWVIRANEGHRLEARGYKAQRWLWRMRIELDQPPAAPQWPAGFSVRTMEPQDERRAYELIETAFVRPGRAPVTYEEWRHYIVEREDFERSLAFLAVREDGEIVGTCMDLLNSNEGWVRQLAVDAPYRRRGLGQSLLLHSFGVFYRRGAKRAGLGVDANNPSATKLYLGAGMTALQEYVQYEKQTA